MLDDRMRQNMIQLLEKANAEMGRMILDVHAMKRSKLEFLAERRDSSLGSRKVVKYNRQDMPKLGDVFSKDRADDKTTPENLDILTKDNMYSADLDSVTKIAAKRLLRDRFPESSEEKGKDYDFMVIDIGFDNTQLVYDTPQLIREISRPKACAMALFLAGSIEKIPDTSIEARLCDVVSVSDQELWDWVFASPSLPWPIERLLRHKDLTEGVLEHLRVLQLLRPQEEREEAKCNDAKGPYMSPEIMRIIRHDKLVSIQSREEAWHTKWNWADVASTQAMTLDDFIDLRSHLDPKTDSKTIRDALSINYPCADVLEIAEWVLKTSPEQKDEWNKENLLGNPHLDRAWMRRLSIYFPSYRENPLPDDHLGKLSNNQGHGVWEVVQDIKVQLKEEHWKNLSKNPTLNRELVREYLSELKFGEMSQNETANLWDIVASTPNDSWDWKALSRNKCITEDAFKQFGADNFDISCMSENKGAGVLAVFQSNPRLPWIAEELVKNPYLDIGMVLAHRDVEWRLSDLIDNGVVPPSYLDVDFLARKPSSFHAFLKGYRKHMEVSRQSSSGTSQPTQERQACDKHMCKKVLIWFSEEEKRAERSKPQKSESVVDSRKPTDSLASGSTDEGDFDQGQASTSDGRRPDDHTRNLIMPGFENEWQSATSSSQSRASGDESSPPQVHKASSDVESEMMDPWNKAERPQVKLPRVGNEQPKATGDRPSHARASSLDSSSGSHAASSLPGSRSDIPPQSADAQVLGALTPASKEGWPTPDWNKAMRKVEVLKERERMSRNTEPKLENDGNGTALNSTSDETEAAGSQAGVKPTSPSSTSSLAAPPVRSEANPDSTDTGTVQQAAPPVQPNEWDGHHPENETTTSENKRLDTLPAETTENNWN